MVIDDDVDRLRPRERFLPEPIAGGGVEGDEAVGFGRELGGKIENPFRPRKKLVHGDHSALNEKGGSLASVPQSVTEGK